MVAALGDQIDVPARSGVVHVLQEQCAVRSCGFLGPAEDVGAPGIVVGQRVRQGIIGVQIPLQPSF